MPDQERQPEDLRIPLHAEEVSVFRREIKKANVQIALVTGTREQLIDEELTHVRVETVRDTVRRQDVEIERDDDATSRTNDTTPMPATVRPKV